MKYWVVYSDYELGARELAFDSAATAKAWLVKQFAHENYWLDCAHKQDDYFDFVKHTKQPEGAESFVDFLIDQGYTVIESYTVTTMEDLLYYQ